MDRGGTKRHVNRPGDPRTLREEELARASDEDCVRLFRRGEPTALVALVRRYTPGLHHLFLRLFSDRELAADATQEVFLKVHSHVARFDPQRSFKAWIYTIAWNLARDRLRSRKRRASSRTISLEAWRHRRESGGTSRELPDPRSRSPEESLESCEEAFWIRKALEKLRPEQRAILVLREYEDLSHEDLAELLGCKLGTIKSRLSRARVELKNVLVELRPEWFERPESPREN